MIFLRMALFTHLAAFAAGCQFSAISVGEVQSVEGRQHDVREADREGWDAFTTQIEECWRAPVCKLPLAELLNVSGITTVPSSCLSVPDARIFFAAEKTVVNWPSVLTMLPAAFTLTAVPIWERYEYKLTALLVSEGRRDLGAIAPEFLAEIKELRIEEFSVDHSLVAASSRKGQINTYTSMLLPIGPLVPEGTGPYTALASVEGRKEPELSRLLLLATLTDLSHQSCHQPPAAAGDYEGVDPPSAAAARARTPGSPRTSHSGTSGSPPRAAPFADPAGGRDAPRWPSPTTRPP